MWLGTQEAAQDRRGSETPHTAAEIVWKAEKLFVRGWRPVDTHRQRRGRPAMKAAARILSPVPVLLPRIPAHRWAGSWLEPQKLHWGHVHRVDDSESRDLAVRSSPPRGGRAAASLGGGGLRDKVTCH